MIRRAAIIVVTILLVGFVAYVIVREGTFEALGQVSAAHLVVLVALSVVVLVLRGLQLSNVATPFGVEIGVSEATGLSAMHSLSNLLPARGSVVIRGAYLREVHGLPVADYTAMTALWMFGGLLTAVLLGLAVGLSGLASTGAWPTSGVFAAGLVGLLVGYVALERLTGWGTGTGRVARLVGRLNRGLRLGRVPAPWRRRFVVYSFALLVASALRFWVILLALGSEASFPDTLIIQALLAMSLLVSITPGNLGVREGVAAAGAVLVAVEVDLALVASLVDRALILGVALAGFGLLGRPLSRRLRQEPREESG